MIMKSVFMSSKGCTVFMAYLVQFAVQIHLELTHSVTKKLLKWVVYEHCQNCMFENGNNTKVHEFWNGEQYL